MRLLQECMCTSDPQLCPPNQIKIEAHRLGDATWTSSSYTQEHAPQWREGANALSSFVKRRRNKTVSVTWSIRESPTWEKGWFSHYEHSHFDIIPSLLKGILTFSTHKEGIVPRGNVLNPPLSRLGSQSVFVSRYQSSSQLVSSIRRERTRIRSQP